MSDITMCRERSCPLPKSWIVSSDMLDGEDCDYFLEAHSHHG